MTQYRPIGAKPLPEPRLTMRTHRNDIWVKILKFTSWKYDLKIVSAKLSVGNFVLVLIREVNMRALQRFSNMIKLFTYCFDVDGIII